MSNTIATAPHNSVLVVGAGIAGMTAAMHLAEKGCSVYLLDTAPAIGGSMHLLDHTFPTNSCGICLMLPHQPALCPTLECDLHERIHILPYAQVQGFTGEPGNYTVSVRHKARYVDIDACTGCGDCGAVCPEVRPHDLEGQLAPVKAIYRPTGQRAVPDAWVIDMDVCTRCGACVPACPTGAIDLEMTDRLEDIAIDAVLLTPGFTPFDARVKGEYGYGIYDNVLSAIEFERMASLAGSSVAQLRRPSDGQAPRRVAFVHCVGSRDNLCGAGYCSSACCMYTAKQVALAKSLDPDLDVTVFFMDLRAFGKDFEAYIEGVQNLPNVHYRRAMPSMVHQRQQTKELLVTYVTEEGQLSEEAFDLLVLAVGFAPPEGMQAVARDMGVLLNDYGFAVTDGYHPTRATGPEGVFVAGAFREPKDIPETVAEAAGAAADVLAYLQSSIDSSPGATVAPETTKPGIQRELAEEEARIGVFACTCNGELDALEIPELVNWASDLPGVAWAQAVPACCDPAGQSELVATIQEKELNRVVVAGCSPRFYGPALEAMMHNAGLDGRLLARVNLREQVLYPHHGNGNSDGAVAKARSMVGMAVAGLKAMTGLEHFPSESRPAPSQRALVIGGGAAGMTAALDLAQMGIGVDLVERQTSLGGQWQQIHYQADGSDPQNALTDLVDRVQNCDSIRLHLGSEVRELTGTPGAYRSVIENRNGNDTIEHGAVIVATGGKPARTDEYLYSRDPRVLTQRELEQQITDGTLAAADTIVMVQCVGSREPERPYCSRVCCTQAVKNALRLKAERPDAQIYVLYREVRTYGFRETYYEAARDAGVVFLRYDIDAKPQVSAKANRLQVRLTDPVTNLSVNLGADLLVLSVGIDPEEESTLAGVLGIARNHDGFFQEEHAKMKPLDAQIIKEAGKAKGGVYIAGLAHSPRFLDETIAQAKGAAMRAASFLTPRSLDEQPTSVWVNERLCSFCGLCVEACPYGARVMNYDTRVADVDYALCHGCGVCAVVCPNKATLQKAFEHKQLLAAVDMALV